MTDDQKQCPQEFTEEGVLGKAECVNVPLSLATNIMRNMRRADCYETIYVSANDAEYDEA